jgi:lysophospholipase L1-like esterase
MPRRRAASRRHAVACIGVCVAALVLAACGAEASGSAGTAASAESADRQRPDVADPVEQPAEKVTVAGDSISVGLGASLRAALDPAVDVKVIGEEGSGLARPDRFDWPGRLEQLAAEFPPDVLVLSLSSNDAQDLADDDGEVVVGFDDQPAWDLEYASRLARSFDAFEDTGTTVLWLGHVRTEEDDVGETNRHVQQLAEQVAASRDWVVVADLADILGSGEEEAEECLQPDGLHLTVECLDLAAASLAGSSPIGPAPAPSDAGG